MLRLIHSLKKYEQGHRPLFLLSFVIFIWAIANGIVSFALPVVMSESLGDTFIFGLVFAASSFFGALFDFYLGFGIVKPNYKKFFYLTLLLTMLLSIFSLKAASLLMFLFIMAIWGVYYEYFHFAVLDFVSRFSKRWEYAESFGLTNMAKSLGYLIGPLIAGGALAVGQKAAFADALVVSLVSLILFHYFFGKQKILLEEPSKKRINIKKEILIWLRIGKTAWPALFSNFLINIWDSTLWSFGAIFLADRLGIKTAGLSFVFLMAPLVFLEGFTGRLADKIGRRRPISYGLVIAGVSLAFFGRIQGFLSAAILLLISSVGIALSLPAANGWLIDLFVKVREDEEEILGIRGLSVNLGYIFGPLLMGFLVSAFGLGQAFMIFGAAIALGGMAISRK